MVGKRSLSTSITTLRTTTKMRKRFTELSLEQLDQRNASLLAQFSKEDMSHPFPPQLRNFLPHSCPIYSRVFVLRLYPRDLTLECVSPAVNLAIGGFAALISSLLLALMLVNNQSDSARNLIWTWTLCMKRRLHQSTI